MAGDLEHYKQIEQRVSTLEQETAELHEGIKRLMELQAADRVNIDKMVLILFGDNRMGLIGLLDRLRDTEEQLMRGRLLQIFITGLAGTLNLAVLVYLFIRLH